MEKKRKSQGMNLDETDPTIYSTFCSAANSLSQLYSQATNHHKISFQAGQRHGLDKLYQWILQKQQGGSRVTIVDILTHLQNDLSCSGDETSRELPHSQDTTITGHEFRSEAALSSPVRLSLQNPHIAQGGYHSNGVQQPSSDHFNSNDSSMGMYEDSPGHQSSHW